MDKQELLNTPPNFYGTEEYHQYSALFRNVLLTDGAKFIADECGAFWLADAIASHLPQINDDFAVAHLCVFPEGGARLTIEDGNDNILAQQDLPYTDFPLDEITLYVAAQPIEDKTFFVIMLTSEY